MESIEGKRRCDFCQKLSGSLKRLRMEGVIYTPCPDCLKTIQNAVAKWYLWSHKNLAEGALLREMKGK